MQEEHHEQSNCGRRRRPVLERDTVIVARELEDIAAIWRGEARCRRLNNTITGQESIDATFGFDSPNDSNRS